MRECLLHWISLFLLLFSALAPAAAPAYAQGGNPDQVGLPGTHQDELGCSGEWQPDCDKTLLSYDAEDDVWQGAFEIQPANDGDKKGPRYKVALNGAWSENYGRNAAPGGADISLVVSQPTQVKFYYDHKTHWVADSVNNIIVVAYGSFQEQLGCTHNDDPTCLRAWLEDPDGDQTYGFTTNLLKAGVYSLSFAFNESAAIPAAPAQNFTVEQDYDSIYFGYDAVKQQTSVSTTGAPAGNLGKQRAIWINADTFLWDAPATPGHSYALVYSQDAALELTPQGVQNGQEIGMHLASAKPGVDLLKAYPYLRDYAVFQLDHAERSTLTGALKGQLAAVVRDPGGRVLDATGVQIPGALDALFPYQGPLGVSLTAGAPILRLWAPTAQQVTLYLYDRADSKFASKKALAWDAASGVWSIQGEPGWIGKYYLYEVKVFVPATGQVETNLVTDPYSFSLSMNSQRSQIVDLSAPDLAPEGWQTLGKPPLAAPEDSVIYELHIRDFSISDDSVPADLRGTYRAFTVKDSSGMQHLASLAQAGLTHIHLLPAFDIASVNEDKSTWQNVDAAALGAEPGDSTAPSEAVLAIKDSDGFNWGYDPLHYTVPDGAYAADPNGPARILEFRQMVQALNQTGLRVVMDVVYNHTNAAGQDPNSVLDRLVPGYYHRLNLDGGVETSTCCQNTASEHAMMRKLMIDSLLVWATAYKVDGFRFDLMGHHMLADMQAVRAALDALTLEQDGVDGRSIILYGEGWDFGEVANNARGKNATQLNIAGSGIGVFNDRLRDAVRGGGPFDDPRVQGFATGLSLENNAAETRPADEISARLGEYLDWIRLSMAGNLAEYKITRSDGRLVSGRLVGYNQNPAGYTADPQENVVYVSAHDNQTLFDAVQIKAPASASLAERIRMNNLALSTVMYSQGIPFFHAGDDLLRSKSFDPNSYNSGDWFNRLDWSEQTNNFGVGLPVEGAAQWDIYRPLLADPAYQPAKDEIQGAAAVFREMLQIRKSSPLFRLQTAGQITRMVSFPNSGPNQAPGIIVLRLVDDDNLDASFRELVVIFNAHPDAVEYSDPTLTGAYELHPIQQQSADVVARQSAFRQGAFSIPGLTTAVFVIPRPPLAQNNTTTAASLPTQVKTSTASESAPQNPADNSPLSLIAAVIIVAAGLGAFLFLRNRRK